MKRSYKFPPEFPARVSRWIFPPKFPPKEKGCKMSAYAISKNDAEKYVKKLRKDITKYLNEELHEDFKLRETTDDVEYNLHIVPDWLPDGDNADRIIVEFEVVRKNGEPVEENMAEHIGEEVDDDLRTKIFARVFGIQDFIFEGGYETGIYWNTEYKVYSTCWSITFMYDIILLPY